MAGGNLCKIIVLLLPATITVGLLSFCLISDWWIGIDEPKLDSFKLGQEDAFQAYLHGEEPSPFKVSTKTAQMFTKATPGAPSVTTTTKTTPTTTIGHFKDEDDYDLYSDDDSMLNNATAMEFDTSYDMENDQKRVKKATNKRQTIQNQNYVYVTKLWPIIKSKSIYSECVRYEKLTLKIGLPFLKMANKEPIYATINYGSLLNTSVKQENDICKGKVGQISCLLTKNCVQGTICDGIVDCADETDENFCDSTKVCHTSNGGFQCDNKCWPYWNNCDQVPHCFNLSDELSNQCSILNEKSSATHKFITPNTFIFGQNQYDYRQKCFRSYFNFKAPKLIEKESLKYLTQSFTDKLQATNIMNYHLHLIYAMALLFAFVFSVLALISLLFMVCLQKSCVQCPFWFYGFFEILTWLSCSFGLMTFLGQKAYANNPVNFPFEHEIYTQNKNFPDFQTVGITFWIAVAANGVSLLASMLSCIFCCRLPSTRHENKEYKIMQLPTYN